MKWTKKKKIISGVTAWLLLANLFSAWGTALEQGKQAVWASGQDIGSQINSSGKWREQGKQAVRTASGQDIGSQIDSAGKRRAQLEQEKQELESDIKKIQKKKGNVLEYIRKLDEQAERLTEKITQNRGDIREVKKSAAKLKKQKQDVIEQKNNQYDIMKRRIKYLYENGEESYLQVLLEADSLAELFNRSEYISQVSDYDNTMFQKYQKTCDRIAASEKALENKLSELQALKESLQLKQDSLDTLSEEKNKELEDYQKQLQEKNQAVDQAENEIKRQEAELERLLERQRQQQEEQERERQREQEKTPSEDNSQTPSEGGYRWPLAAAGRITSYFGYRSAPTAGASSYHKGIDIAVPSGTQVLATKAGTVVAAAYSSSAGNYVSIYHGAGVYSYYMHCSSLSVSTGMTVSAGQQVALSGSTGISTGPHLHFAIYAGGAYVDPLRYISQ